MNSNPVKNTEATSITKGSIGVAINGIQFRPGTARYYAENAKGHSLSNNSGWNLDAIGSRDKIGLDKYNGHVDRHGLYHYHAVTSALISFAATSLIGYAADGFKIHYVGDKQTSSYRLKSGQRPSPPYGDYDGSFNEDWEYVEGAGSLDKCNGGNLNGKFVYFATDTYPFFPRCLWGDISNDFNTMLKTQAKKQLHRLRFDKDKVHVDNDEKHAVITTSDDTKSFSINDNSSDAIEERITIIENNTETSAPVEDKENSFSLATLSIDACTNKVENDACSFNIPNNNSIAVGHCEQPFDGTLACMAPKE